MARIPLFNPEDLPSEIYEGWKGTKLNLTLIMAHARTMYPGYRAMTHALFAQLDIPPQERELIVLAVLHLDHGEYQWAQHAAIALDNGIPAAKIDAIARDRFNLDVFSEREKALLAFTRQVVRTVRVDDAIFDAVAAFYSPRQIVELIFTVGHYMLLLRFSEVCELEPEARAGGVDLVRAAVAKETAGAS